MKSTNCTNKIHPQLEAAFKSQDPELFDIIFDFDGKKLYADKLSLSNISSTFESMLSDRWISKNDSIKIKTYKYDDFKELITFIYSGKCIITNENIYTILDISEFYQIEDLKKICDKYLSEIELNLSNVFQLIETSNKYSLFQMKEPIETFIFQNFTNLAKFDGFLNSDKSIIKEIVTMESNFSKHHEDRFQCIYEWSENQAIEKQRLSNDENFNMNDAIKTEMHELLPNIQFNKMKLYFLREFVVPRGFIFTSDELADILKNPNSDARVEITNSIGQTIFGDLCRKQKHEIEIIKSLNGRASNNKFIYSCIYWETNCEKPSTPCHLKKRNGVQWYLTYFDDGDIGVKHCGDIDHRYYLIAEMFSEKDFEVTRKCKIKIE
uniref:BTB domain-containing protein n=1 Tax=Panagrolaimus davidi TaxID=227884 RepID=A0A914QBW3_9BILA